MNIQPCENYSVFIQELAALSKSPGRSSSVDAFIKANWQHITEHLSDPELKAALDALAKKLQASKGPKTQALGGRVKTIANTLLSAEWESLPNHVRKIILGKVPLAEAKVRQTSRQVKAGFDSDEATLHRINTQKESMLHAMKVLGAEHDSAAMLDKVCSFGAELHYLDLTGYDLTAAQLQRVITACPNVQLLQIQSSSLQELGALSLANLKALRILTLRSCPALTRVAIPHTVNELRLLDLETLADIAELKQLEHLELSDCPALESLPQMASLTRAELTRCERLSQLPTYPQLQRLSLNTLPQIERLPHLPALQLLESVLLTGLSELGDLKAVQFLTLSGCLKATDLGALDQVRELGLEDCPVRSLPQLPRLSSLYVGDCRQIKAIGDMPEAVLVLLKKNPLLQQLGATQESAQVFTESCPLLSE